MISSLSDTQSLSSAMYPGPAQELASRYALRLSPVWQNWFERGAELLSETGEFSQPAEVPMLIEQRPELIWPGFMLPDTLPILGNGYGDWLCMRVNADNTAGEVVHWYHGGGDWMPWGRNPAEAIAFDRLRQRLPGRRVAHATRPAEPSTDPTLPDPLADWAAGYMPTRLATWLQNPDHEPSAAWEVWTDDEIAFEAIQAEHSLVALDGVLRQRLRADIARKLNVPWEPEVVRWLFDEQQVPPEQRHSLVSLLQIEPELLERQDWATATACCQTVQQQRSDLGWSWDMTGWIAERQGRYDEAIRCYLASLQTSSFSDQSIRFRTHWFPEPFGRFAAYRLWQLRDHLSAHQRPDALLQCYWSSSPGLRQRVYEYWITQADLAAEQGSPAAEYDALYRAGWDLGVDDLTGYGPLLQRMADAAQRAGQHARAEVARTHCNCLIQRF